jgi:23S rRNA pseudouridine2605 synthase
MSNNKSTPPKSDEQIRLNKYIADSGLASRRAADQLILDGLVKVNGKKVYELGTKINPSEDHVLVDGKSVRKKAPHIYVVFHKPKGVLTTMEDPLGRENVSDYLAKVPYRVFPVGRLDYDSEGLLLLTNDGDFANRVMHPKEEVTKTYLVKVDGQPAPHHIAKLLSGVSIIGGKVAAKYVEKIPKGGDQYAWFKIIITEGKNRQIRQMFFKIGFDVIKLQRVAIGRLKIGNLQRGEVAFLNEAALERIFMPDDPEELKARLANKPKQQSKGLAPRGGGKHPLRKSASKKSPKAAAHAKKAFSKKEFVHNKK